MTKKGKGKVVALAPAAPAPVQAQGANTEGQPQKKVAVIFELTAEEKAQAAALSIEKGLRLVNKSLTHDLKVARFIKGEFQAPKRLISKEDLLKVLETIEAGAGYGDLNGKRVALAAITKDKIDAQCIDKAEEFARLPLNEEQQGAIARTMPKYKAFLEKYVNSQAIQMLKQTFGVAA